MALPELLEALRAEAAERRAARLAEADAEAERVRSAGASARELLRREALEEASRVEEAIGRRQLARARSEAVSGELAARDRLLARVRTALEARVRGAASDPEYVGTLARDLARALDRLPSGGVIVRASPALAPGLHEQVAGREGVEVRAADEIGTGFRARTGDGRAEVDATLETRLRHAWPQLAVLVVRAAEP